jgi:hypothetical protein
MSEQSIFLGKGAMPQHLMLKRANRHGLIAGATGTGKTVSLQILAEGFSAHGVPVFMADVKGVPSMVDRALIRPPSSRLGPASPQERNSVIAQSFCQGKYGQLEDRVSAYEKLQQRAEQAAR